MFAVSSVRCNIWILIIFLLIEFGSGARYINGDFLVKGMDPVQTEPQPCCDSESKIPAEALVEISYMTSDQFVKKFSPQTDTSVLGSPYFLENTPTVESSDAKVGPSLNNEVRLLQPELLMVEDNFDIKPDSPISVLPSANFRSARLELGTVDPPMAENARCLPRDSVVPMPKSLNASLTIWPQCTIIKRCGGCCGDSGLVCKPTESRLVTRKGMHLAYLRGKLQVVGQAVATLTEDLNCSCVCRQNASNCSANQRYDAGNCRCLCLDSSMAASCGPHRVWDPEQCLCKCPNAGGFCPLGFTFDTNFYCACLPSTNFRQSKRLSKSVSVPFAQSDEMTFARRRVFS